jgi:excinuclease ABC subunit B
MSSSDLADRIEAVRQEMFAAAENLEFEKAARLRDQLRLLKGDEGADAVSAVAAGPASRKAARASKSGAANASAASKRRSGVR